MKTEILSRKNFKTSNWSGGTTTQLFIYPSNADYQQLNFDFRLSSAQVESEKSKFTSLPGVSRKLMILEGEIILNHQHHYTKKLAIFEVDAFEGNWETTSIGICTDFNLMTTGKKKGEITAMTVEKNEQKEYKIENCTEWLFIYLYSGHISVLLDQQPQLLSKGELWVINQIAVKNLQITGIENSQVIFSKIW